jgi:uncharacterized membrane protein
VRHENGIRGPYGAVMSRRISPAAVAVAAILGSAGVAHFVRPSFFDPLVPSWMPGSARRVTYVSGVVEAMSAALVVHPRTRRAGGLLALATFVGVWPANIQAALDGGMKDLDPPLDSAAAAWIRVPLQLPLIWLAWRTTRRAGHHRSAQLVSR